MLLGGGLLCELFSELLEVEGFRVNFSLSVFLREVGVLGLDQVFGSHTSHEFVPHFDGLGVLDEEGAQRDEQESRDRETFANGRHFIILIFLFITTIFRLIYF